MYAYVFEETPAIATATASLVVMVVKQVIVQFRLKLNKSCLKFLTFFYHHININQKDQTESSVVKTRPQE